MNDCKMQQYDKNTKIQKWMKKKCFKEVYFYECYECLKNKSLEFGPLFLVVY